jgi:uncharacterized protein DUF6878
MSTAFDYEALEEAGLEVVKISYSGSNDEGFINEITIEQPELPAGADDSVGDDLYRVLERQAYDLLEVKHGGWEINEGAEGHITVNVKERKAFIHHGEHYESTNWHDSTV